MLLKVSLVLLKQQEKKINDFSEKTFTHLVTALKELKNLDSESRNALIQFFKILLVENTNSRKEYKKNKSNS